MSEEVKIIVSQKGTIPVYTSTKVGGGESAVLHDDTLQGSGSSTQPLGIAQNILNKINRGGDTFVFEFDNSQLVWTINHKLNKKPSVTVVDSANNVLTPSVQYIDNNNLTIEFNAPFKGTAYLN